jgi:hypothetical protein
VPVTSIVVEGLIAIPLLGEMSAETSLIGMFEGTLPEEGGLWAAATMAGSTTVTSGASGVVDGGPTVLAHVGG